MYPPTFFGLLVDRCDLGELWDWSGQLDLVLPEAGPLLAEAGPCTLRRARGLENG